MKKAYITPNSILSAVATSQLLAGSGADQIYKRDGSSIIDETQTIERKDNPFWSGSKQNNFSDTDE